MKIKRLIMYSLIVFSLIPLAFVAILFGVSLSNAVEESFEQNLIASVSIYADAVNTFFEERIQLTHIMLEVPYLRELYKMSLSDSVLKSEYAYTYDTLNEYITERVSSLSHLSSIIFINRNLEIFFSNNKQLEGQRAEESIRLLNRAPGAYTITSIEQASGGIYSEPYFSIAIPVWNKTETEFLGYILQTYNMKPFETIKNQSFLFKTGYYFLVDKQGTYAVNGHDENTARTMAENTDVSNILNQFTTINPKTKTNDFIEYSYDGIKKIAYYQVIPTGEWLLFSSVDKAEIYQSRNNIIWLLFLFSCSWAFIAFLASFQTTHRIIGPMHLLLSTIRNIQAGDLSSRFTYSRNNEFGDIARMFNALMDGITQKTKELELHTEQLRQSTDRYRIISDHTKEIIFEWDFITDEAEYSVNWWKKFGYDPCTKNVSTLFAQEVIVHPDDKKVFMRWIQNTFKSDRISREEFRILASDEQYYWVQVRTIPICDNMGVAIKLIGLIQDIDEMKIKQNELISQAEFDFLSNIYNRGTFEKKVISSIEKNHQKHLAFIFIDIDDFRLYNTRFGHAFGDRVIEFIGKTIKEVISEKGFAGRVGGDEFIICITHENTLCSIEDFAQNLINLLKCGVQVRESDDNIPVQCSMGIVFFPETAATFAELSAKADSLMYGVKKRGKCGYAIAVPQDLQNLQNIVSFKS